jgi:hypothetical protein
MRNLSALGQVEVPHSGIAFRTVRLIVPSSNSFWVLLTARHH